VLEMGVFPGFIPFFCVVGIWECLRRKVYLWPLMTLVVAVLTPRQLQTVVVIPNSVLAAIGAGYVWQSVSEQISGAASRFRETVWVKNLTGINGFAVPLAVLSLLAVLDHSKSLVEKDMNPVSNDAYAAMTWIADNIPKDSKFALLADGHWSVEEVGEWFPRITGSQSLTTVQGTEWLPGGVYAMREEASDKLKRALRCPLVLDVLDADYPEAEYLMTELPLDCLQTDARWRLIHGNGKALVFQSNRTGSEDVQPQVGSGTD
jgi:hypothetical protein